MDERREFEAGPWKVVVTKSHILRSSCERGTAKGCREGGDSCTVCRWLLEPYCRGREWKLSEHIAHS